jgi:glycerol-3-phosphate cytidylyltransferase-like family protein
MSQGYRLEGRAGGKNPYMTEKERARVVRAIRLIREATDAVLKCPADMRQAEARSHLDAAGRIVLRFHDDNSG